MWLACCWILNTTNSAGRRGANPTFGSNTTHCVSRALDSSMKTVKRRNVDVLPFGAARHAVANPVNPGGGRLVHAARRVSSCVESGHEAPAQSVIAGAQRPCMFPRSMIRLRTELMVSLAVILLGCRTSTPEREPAPPSPEGQPPVVLPAPSKEPRYSIAVDDPDEIALLAQQVKLGRVVASRGRMYFSADESQLGRLRELGYEVTQADPEAVDYRVLRARRRASEEDLRSQGITIIAREKAYWVISGTLGQLRRLAAAGYRLDPIAPDEPHHKLIVIVVASRDDVQRVANYQVDIFTVSDTTGRRFAIHGAALDMQIDQLRAAGFTVTVLP